MGCVGALDSAIDYERVSICKGMKEREESTIVIVFERGKR